MQSTDTEDQRMLSGKMRPVPAAIFKRLPLVRKVYDLKLARDQLLTERPAIERQRDEALLRCHDLELERERLLAERPIIESERDQAIRAREQGEARMAHLERELIRSQQAAEARQAELGRIADIERERGAAEK